MRGSFSSVRVCHFFYELQSVTWGLRNLPRTLQFLRIYFDMKKITTAVIPVAGMGTRLLPVTKSIPKELLPIYDRPAVQLIAEEAIEAGITKIIFVIHPSKEAIRDHFTKNDDLHDDLKSKNKESYSDKLHAIESAAEFKFVYQNEALGDGHAVLQAINELDKDESFVVLFGDDIVDNEGGKNAVEQLLDVYEKHHAPIVLLQEVPSNETHLYGIVNVDDELKINKIIEKPEQGSAPSNLAIVGKYILTPEVLNVIKEVDPHKDGEIRLSGAFEKMINDGDSIYGCSMKGRRFDTGNLEGLFEAAVYFAKKSQQ